MPYGWLEELEIRGFVERPENLGPFAKHLLHALRQSSYLLVGRANDDLSGCEWRGHDTRI
ncbi:hypothetical protein GJ744_001861 [Endocarpon pusillum]|uniref:Uncharacterized protein n=1 Tax=Endocarpon pusillum TaxID=364733 RepID=A0A8H7E8M7_9EURO|nr:hypothetical protein GJ744_001861 [Endocarpon pusillum]